jgi:hypothetical protein
MGMARNRGKGNGDGRYHTSTVNSFFQKITHCPRAVSTGIKGEHHRGYDETRKNILLQAQVVSHFPKGFASKDNFPEKILSEFCSCLFAATTNLV